MIGVAKERTDGTLNDDNDSGGNESEEDMEIDGDDEDETSVSEDDSDVDSEADLDETHNTNCLDLFIHDMGHGTGFRPGNSSTSLFLVTCIVIGTFDGCISISALQWLCHSNRSHEIPKARLMRLFNTLFGCLARGARAVFQFYPETSTQIDLILGCAMKVEHPPLVYPYLLLFVSFQAGFTGGLVVDFPQSAKAKKYYLCLMTGPAVALPTALQETVPANDHVAVDKRARSRHQGRHVPSVNRKEWVQSKKELARKRGHEVKADSKYTARKRRIRF